MALTHADILWLKATWDYTENVSAKKQGNWLLLIRTERLKSRICQTHCTLLLITSPKAFSTQWSWKAVWPIYQKTAQTITSRLDSRRDYNYKTGVVWKNQILSEKDVWMQKKFSGCGIWVELFWNVLLSEYFHHRAVQTAVEFDHKFLLGRLFCISNI